MPRTINRVGDISTELTASMDVSNYGNADLGSSVVLYCPNCRDSERQHKKIRVPWGEYNEDRWFSCPDCGTKMEKANSSVKASYNSKVVKTNKPINKGLVDDLTSKFESSQERRLEAFDRAVIGKRSGETGET